MAEETPADPEESTTCDCGHPEWFGFVFTWYADGSADVEKFRDHEAGALRLIAINKEKDLLEELGRKPARGRRIVRTDLVYHPDEDFGLRAVKQTRKRIAKKNRLYYNCRLGKRAAREDVLHFPPMEQDE